jgi:hypothetical protein
MKMSKAEAIKELESTYDIIHTYSQHPTFQQEEWEARQKAITLQEYIKSI